MHPGLPLCLALNQNKFIFQTKTYHMNKIVLFVFAAMLTASGLSAQKYAVIDTRYILDKMPDYKNAQKQLDDIAAEWQKDIDSKQASLDKMYKDYDAEQVMLSDDLKKKRQDQLFNREKEVRDLQRKRFGYEGDLFKLRQELVKPIQDKVYNAIQQLAVNRMYEFILDKSEGITVI